MASRQPTRREILRTLLWAGGSLAVNGQAWARARPADDADVLVLGAGIAGLTAARDLATQHMRVVVLEARDRIGGRLWTDRTTASIPLDLGASWIHGVQGNPLVALARRAEVRTAPTNYENLTRFDAQGRQLSPAADRAVDRRFADLSRFIADERRRRARLDLPDQPLAAAIADFIAARGLTGTARRELDYAVVSEIEQEWAGDVADLSFDWWDQDGELPGGDVLLLDGYDRIAALQATGLEVRLGTIVRRVERQAERVRVTTDGGVFTAPRAVVALPLGVLQAHVSFAPALPARKLRALAHLGMGVLDKLYLRFPRPFWSGADSELLGYVATTRGSFTEWLDLHHYTGEPVLLVFHAGSAALAVEAKSDAVLAAEAMVVLRSIFGPGAPDPLAVRTVRWGADPFSHGSYSHLRTGGVPGDYDALAAAIDGRLFFAGEATHRRFPATVHGALLSGQRAARELVASL